MNTSLEVEYWVVDEDGALSPPGSLLDIADWIDPEFVEPMIELKTSPCASMEALREEFLDRLETLLGAATARDLNLVPLATPLAAAPAEVPYREKRITNLQRQIVGRTFDDARVCAGTHLHFERSNEVAQINALTALDPAFSLVSSSAYYRGERILSCARQFLYRRSCYKPCPRQGQLWPYVDSRSEWERRLEDAYDGFRERAIHRGVDASEFDEAFDPYDAVWTPVRLRSAMPTVEWRSPDVTVPSQTLRLAAAVRSIVTQADERGTAIAGHDASGAATGEEVRLPSFDTVENVVEAAIHDGVQGPGVRNYLRTLGFSPSDYEPLADRATAPRLTKRQATRHRLEAATLLERDLNRVRGRNSNPIGLG